MVMPNELTYPADDGVNGVKRRGRIHLGFEPPPEAFNRVILRGIRRQMFKGHPVVLHEKPFHGTALVNRGIIQDQDQAGVRKALMELMQKLQKARRGAACSSLPIEALGAEMQRAEEGRTLTLRGCRDFDLVALATPAPLDVGFIGKMRFIDTEDLYGPLRLADANGGDNFCHPRFFFAGLGALRGTVLAKRF
jgi:hypothetical protein